MKRIEGDLARRQTDWRQDAERESKLILWLAAVTAAVILWMIGRAL